MALEGRSLTAQKAETVRELVSEGFRLDLLLKTAKLARSTYYYQLKRFNRTNKDKKVKEMIQTIYDDHKGNYGYRRMGLAARTRCKRKYSSYKGEIGKKADNLIQRQFEGAKPYEKCYTDVTEFALPNIKEKVYLSPILDGYNSEIIEFTLSRSPDLKQIQTMLKKAFPDDSYQGTILHSDQGWQYQHQSYHDFLASKGIRPSMSRKGNSPDNGMMESFFGILKSEMFYGYEKTFKSIDKLEQAITDYIFYDNNKRIKTKLKELSPVQYRTKSLQ